MTGPVIDFGGESWREEALCAETSPDAFFPELGESSRPAKAICARCEVRVECLDWALANNMRFGVWGGKSEADRKKIRDQQVVA